jgi:hypothetical protein
MLHQTAAAEDIFIERFVSTVHARLGPRRQKQGDKSSKNICSKKSEEINSTHWREKRDAGAIV